jgi:putative oxidoreductase
MTQLWCLSGSEVARLVRTRKVSASEVADAALKRLDSVNPQITDFPGRFPIARWASIPLRLIVAFGFMEHGFAKLSKGPDTFAAILHALAVPAPHFVAWITILTELLGGLAILLGAFVSLVSLPMAALLLLAIFTVHLPYGFSSIKLISVTATGAQFGPPGYECDLLYLACLAALVLGGSGPWAIDGLLRKNNVR